MALSSAVHVAANGLNTFSRYFPNAKAFSCSFLAHLPSFNLIGGWELAVVLIVWWLSVTNS
jgi:hypothetical protein